MSIGFGRFRTNKRHIHKGNILESIIHPRIVVGTNIRSTHLLPSLTHHTI